MFVVVLVVQIHLSFSSQGEHCIGAKKFPIQLFHSDHIQIDGSLVVNSRDYLTCLCQLCSAKSKG